MKPPRLLIAVVALIVTLAVFPLLPAVAQDDPTTTSIFISEDGRMSVQLPEGWYANGGVASLRVVNSEALLDPDSDIVTAGDRGFVVLPLVRAEFESIGLAPDATLTEIVEVLLPVLTNEEQGTVLGEPEALGDSVIRITVSDVDNDGVFYLADHLAPGVVGLVPIAAPKGEFNDEVEAEMLEIVESVQYALDLTETYTSADGSLSLSHPVGWIVQEDEQGFVSLYDSQATADAAAADEDPAPTQAALLVTSLDLSAEEVTDELLLSYASEIATQIAADSENNPVLEAPVFVESEALTQRVVLVEATSDISEGGVLLTYDAETGQAALVIYVGGTDIGDRLIHTA